jgi:flagellin
MALQVNKAAGIGLNHQINERQKSLSKIHEKMGTGKRINRAQDDAAGLAIAKLLESMSRGYKADRINIGDAMSAMNIGEGATQGITDMLGRMRELSTQAANDTLSDSDRKALNLEFQELKKEIDRQSRGTQFNTQDLLSGQSPLSDGTGNFQVGPNAGGPNLIPVNESNLTPEALGIADMDISTRNGAVAAIDGIGKATNDVVNSVRVNFGVQYNRLEHAYNNNENLNANTTAALALIESLDYAQASMEKARDDILNQSAILAQRNFQDISKNSMLALLGQT